MLKAPPKFVTNVGAWEYVLARMAHKQEEDGKRRLDEYGNPLNYGAAVGYYKNAAKKYPAFQTANVHIPEYRDVGNNIADLMDIYPVGQMFWFDDVICEAVEYGSTGEAVYSDAQGVLFVRGKILDVDPEGAHKGWPVGKVNGFPPRRMALLMDGAS